MGRSVDREVPANIGRGALRELARLLLESIAAGAFVSLVLGLAVFIVATQAQGAATPVPQSAVTPAPQDTPTPVQQGAKTPVPRSAATPVQQGTLLLRDDAGERAAAPLLFTDVHIDVSGMTARASVTQRFVNPTAQWREGVYVFPLPAQAAVDHLDMRIGTRTIEGQVRERQAARQAYEQAKADDRKASLVEQERPNLFTTNVAHIGPGEEIVVSIQYQQKLTYDAGSFRLRFPMAITPRYIPGAPLPVAYTQSAGTGGTGVAPPTDAVADADRISPPLADPAQGALNPVSLSIDVDAGFPLATLSSTYHPVRVEERPGNRYHVELAQAVVPAARDFELVYAADVGAAPGAALFTEAVDGRTYALLMVLPPSVSATAAANGQRQPREVTYIVDTSGSMEGVSIAQAREALLVALERLQPGDRFNVIEFNSVTRPLFTAPMPADAATLERAHSFVRGLRARGGTEMKPALDAAFASARTDDRMRQVVFITDGAVGNEAALLQLIERRVGDRRLFTVGIGPAPNAWFMKKAAEAGRGTFTFIGDVREVKDKMTALVRKLENPVLTGVHVDWPAGVETYPPQLPDLYSGEPVLLTAMLGRDARDGQVKLTGNRGDQAWHAALPLDIGAAQPGIGVLYARDKIEALTDAGRNGADPDEVKRQVVAVALAHHLVSAYTSLVAVDVTPTAPPGSPAPKSALPVNLPQGLVYDALAGGLPQTATFATAQIIAGASLLMLALFAYAGLKWRGRRADRLPDAWQRLLAATRAARGTC